MTEHLAWPAAAVTIFLLFKNEWRLLLQRLIKFKGLGIEGEFKHELLEVEAIAVEAQLPAVPMSSTTSTTTTTSGQLPAPPETPGEYMIRESPREAIVFMWSYVEKE